MTPKGLALLIQVEGKRHLVYDDNTGETIYPKSKAKGEATIGVGHRLTLNELGSGQINIGGERVDWRPGLNDSEINRLLKQDIAWAEAVVDECVVVPLSPNQRDALVCFAFNIGESAFRACGAIRALNAGNVPLFLTRHRQWTRSKGKVMPGLVKRRRLEAELFMDEGEVVS